MNNRVILLLIIFLLSFFSCNKGVKEKRIDVSTAKDKENGIIKYNFYDKEGKLNKKLEYIDLCGKKYLNQGWYFNKNGDSLLDKSNFFKINVSKKTIKVNEISNVRMFYKPLFKNSYSGILLARNRTNDYCELNNNLFDTIYFVNNKLEFEQSFKSVGSKVIFGYILEIKPTGTKVNKKAVYDERKVYFKIPFEVR